MSALKGPPPAAVQEAPTHPAWLLGDCGPQSSSQAHLSVPSRCPRLGAGALGKTSSPAHLPGVDSVFFCWRQGGWLRCALASTHSCQQRWLCLSLSSHPYLGPQRALEGNLALLPQFTCSHQSILCVPPSRLCHPPVSQRTYPVPTYAGGVHPTLSPKALGRGLGLEGSRFLWQQPST